MYIHTHVYTYFVVHLLRCVRLFAAPWTAANKASLSFTISRSLLKLMPTESAMPSNHPILCSPLLLLPSIFPSFRIFSNESALRIRWPKYWSFSFDISPSNVYIYIYMCLCIHLYLYLFSIFISLFIDRKRSTHLSMLLGWWTQPALPCAGLCLRPLGWSSEQGSSPT